MDYTLWTYELDDLIPPVRLKYVARDEAVVDACVSYQWTSLFHVYTRTRTRIFILLQAGQLFLSYVDHLGDSTLGRLILRWFEVYRSS